MKLGFTGTRRGISDKQREAFRELLWCQMPVELHHGDCVGADAATHYAFCEYLHTEGSVGERIFTHPPDSDSMRAGVSSLADWDMVSIVEAEPLPYLTRNRNIVDSTDLLVACPAEFEEQQRGGTWSTVRYARKVGKPVVIIYPDGSVAEEKGRA